MLKKISILMFTLFLLGCSNAQYDELKQKHMATILELQHRKLEKQDDLARINSQLPNVKNEKEVEILKKQRQLKLSEIELLDIQIRDMSNQAYHNRYISGQPSPKTSNNTLLTIGLSILTGAVVILSGAL